MSDEAAESWRINLSQLTSGVVDRRKEWGVSQTCNHGHKKGIAHIKAEWFLVHACRS